MPPHKAGLAAGRAGPDPLEPGNFHHRYQSRLSLEVVCTVILQLEDTADQPGSLGAEEDLTAFREVLQPGGEIDGVTERAGVGGVEGTGAGDDDTCVDPGVHHERRSDATLVARAELVDSSMDLEGGADGALGIVFMSDWIAEHRHDRVSEELVDPSRVPLDDLGGPGEYLTHHSLDILGIEMLGHGGEAREVTEDDRYLSPLGTPWGPGIEGVATLIAETRPVWVVETAVAAHRADVNGVHRWLTLNPRHSTQPFRCHQSGGRKRRQCPCGRLGHGQPTVG